MQNINVNIVPDSYPQTIRYSQGDVGREFKINVVGFSIPAGATVKIQATKPSGFGFSVAGTVDGDSVSFTTTAIMTDEAGRFPAELEITKDSVVIGTANFIMWGEANPHPEGTTDGQQGTIIPELTLLVERVEAAASSVLDMEVVAETLPAGSQATYSYDEDLNKATFGIPQGEAGAGAAGVVASAYSASATYKVGDYVIHNSNLYRCTTAITTAEAFTAAHWTQIVLANDVSDLKTDLAQDLIGNEFIKGTFQRTSLWQGNPSSAQYRVSETDIISYPFDITLYIAYGFRIGVHYFENGSFVSDSGWQEGLYTIQANKNFKIVIARVTASESTSEVADIDLFRSQVYFKNNIGKNKTNANGLMEELPINNKGSQTFRGLGNFQPFGLNSDGSFMKTQQYRVSNDDFMTFDRGITISVKSGFKWGYIKNVSGTKTWMGWYTTPIKMPSGLSFVVQIARATEDYIPVTDINEFVDALTFNSVVGDRLDNLENLASITEESLGTSPIITTWEQGGISGETGRDTTDDSRIRTKDFIPMGDKVAVVVENGYQAGILQFDKTHAVTSYTPWMKSNFEVSRDANAVYFRVVFAYADVYIAIAPTENTHIKIHNIYTNLGERVAKSEPDQYANKYIGEKMPSKVHGFNAELFLTMAYDNPLTSQDIDIFGNYMFVAFSGDDLIRVYSMADQSLVASLEADTQHGSGMQFSNEYYADGDTFPLLYVGGWTSNLINVVRITLSGSTWSATIVRTLKIPTTYGSYASPSIDGANNILYTYAHSNSSIPNSDNMIIASWDLNTLTDNGDDTYTPKLLGQCESPSVGVYQGHKYYGGRIYITSSNTGSPWVLKIFAIDCGSGEIVTTIDLSDILNAETEGLCYKINGNNIEWYVSEWHEIYKLTFN